MYLYRKFSKQSFGILLIIGVLVGFSILVFSRTNQFIPIPYTQAKAYKYSIFAKAKIQSEEMSLQATKLDATARMLLNASIAGNERSINSFLYKSGSSGNMIGSLLSVDLFINLQPGYSAGKLQSYGVEIRSQIGNIVIVRAPIESLIPLVEEPAVRKIELSRTMKPLLDASRIDINADDVHQGVNLPQGYDGEGVIVGVLDTGIDFNHPDFSNQNGSRIQYLLEFNDGGGQSEWTKDDIDNNPNLVTQIDGDGGRGHGTHVAGTAAGGGQLNTDFSGIAPAADIIFVKGTRQADGGGSFSDTDVIAGCEFIFDKADDLGKPAVINLSIGGHSGPHDGTSLYEQSLSNLTGPGRLIVAAAGNSGDDFIHAGGTSTPGVMNETIMVADSSDQFAVGEMWYDAGTISQVSVFAYDDQFNVLGSISSVNVGMFVDFTPIMSNGDTLGLVAIDAQTIIDANNGDGNVVFVVKNNDSPNIDISNVTWGLASMGQASGRTDLWATTGSHFYKDMVGFQDVNEMPGNNDYSVTTPSTAKKIIAVGAYLTKNTWSAEDGNSYNRIYPDPNNPDDTFVPSIGEIAFFTGRGPTRDERMSPDVSAPGDVIFAPLSSHLTEGVGFRLSRVLEGGGYLGLQGTSMASPHTAGTLALMLQAKPNLTYGEALQALTETARSNSFTGNTPNNTVGAGYIDAHAAVQRAVDFANSIDDRGGAIPEIFVLKQNYPNPFNPSTTIEFELNFIAQASLTVYNIAGQEIKTVFNEEKEAGSYAIQWDGTNNSGQKVASGIYYVKFKAGDLFKIRKMVLMR